MQVGSASNFEAAICISEMNIGQPWRRTCRAHLGPAKVSAGVSGNEGFCLEAKCSVDGLAIFGVVDVNQAPIPGFFAVDLGFDTVCGYG